MDDSVSLDRLHDIVVPPEVSAWPLTLGWWIVLVVLFAILAFATYAAWRRWQANAYRRVALRELESASGLAEIAAILRRCALVFMPRETIAAKTGNDWPSWLDAASAEKMPDDVRSLLVSGAYVGTVQASAVTQLRDYATHWVRSHNRPEGAA